MMFELNDILKIKESKLEGSKIYTIDNFYKNPREIVRFFIDNIPKELHKSDENGSKNGVFFEDKRHSIRNDQIKSVYNFLSSLINQKPFKDDDEIVTNFTRFKDKKFNNYKNNYWWPHNDPGYNGIVYLNRFDRECGTNLYSINILEDHYLRGGEHTNSWIDKRVYTLLETLKPRYNRLVLFDGKKFIHGMNIVNNRYFGRKYRMNQVFFFEEM